MQLRREKRHRRRGHDVGDARELLGRSLRRLHEGVDRIGRRGQDQHPADDRAHLLESELESRRDAEVAAAPADRPEEVGVRLGVHAEDLAVGGDDLGGEEVVDREAVLAHEISDASAEREPADPDRAGVAERRREAMLRCGVGVPARREPCLGPRRAALDVDLQTVQVAKVEDDPAHGRAVTGDAVAAAPDGEVDPGLTRELDHARDVGDVRGHHDRRGAAVDSSVEDGARRVVLAVARRLDAARELEAQLLDRDSGSRS